MQDKTGQNLNREVLRLAIPAIISNITIPLLGLCDTTIAGHLGDVAIMGAIAIGSMSLNVVSWLLGFLRMGTTGLSAEAYGKRSRHLCVDILRKSLILATLASLLTLLFQTQLLDVILRYMSPEADVARFATTYFDICIWGVPAQLFIMAASGWFVGMQNTTVPMAIAISVNAFNILLSYSLAFPAGMGLTGIATGTLVSNWTGALISLTICMIWVRGKRGPMAAFPSDHDMENDHTRRGVRWSRFFKVNGYLFLRSACVMGVSVSVTAFGSRMGEVTLAANTVIMQFFIFFSYFMDGFAYAAEALVGRCYGSGDRERLARSVKVLLRWGAAMALTFFTIYLFGSRFIASLIAEDAGVLAVVDRMYVWIILLPPITVLAFLFDGIYIGLSRTDIMMWSTLCGALLFFLLTCMGGEPTHDNRMLWTGFELYLMVRGLVLGCNYFMRKRG